MAQKADDNHTSSGQPVGPTSTASPSTAANRPRVVYANPPVWMRAVVDLPLDQFISLNEAFARAKSRLGSGELTAVALKQDALHKRLTMAAWRISRDGTAPQAFIFRSKFWQHYEFWEPNPSFPEVVRVRPRGHTHLSLRGSWCFFVGRRRFDRLYSATNPGKSMASSSTLPSSAPISSSSTIIPAAIHAKRGRKPYDWELYQAKFYLMLDDDDVPAHADINVAKYASRLMDWGSNNNFDIPGQTQMREKVAEWKSLWKRLKSANK